VQKAHAGSMDSEPLKENKVSFKKISKSQIHGISSMEVEGRETYLGELRNFKNHSFLEQFLPKDFSIGWVSLPAGKTLEPHFHPCSSMIIITKGEGMSLGDSEILLKEGGVIHIPAWNLHGFKGLGANGFEGLSLQFQETAIFESKNTPETSYESREQTPLSQRQLVRFEREGLESINSVETNGTERQLGIVKNFRKNKELSQLLPDTFSAAWVHLGGNETLVTHQHQEKSVILITSGTGEVFDGESRHSLKSGDGVFVPSQAIHGFKGTGEGFWGLSFQFNPTSLYEDTSQPRVHFLSSFEKLKIANEKKFQELESLPIFRIPQKDFEKNPLLKRRLLDCLQVMSHRFQTLMFSRVSLTNSSDYKKIFMEHLLDELGHDTSLEEERGQKGVDLWDPVLDASTSWFLSQVYTIDDPKRIIMVSMVLEKCAGKFYGHFAEILKGGLESSHIENHCDADPYHETLGLNLIEKDCESRLAEFIEFQGKAWDIMILYLKRTGELVSEVQ